MKRAVLLLAVGLAGCGAAKPLQPPPGTALPVAPYGARATPTPPSWSAGMPGGSWGA